MQSVTVYHRSYLPSDARILEVGEQYDVGIAIVSDDAINVYAPKRPVTTATQVAYALGLDVTEVASPARGVRLDDLLSNVSSEYGAPMGRSNDIGLSLYTGKLHLQRVNLDSGGYDKGGAYWGGHSASGGTLYCAFTADGDVMHFMRASNRAEALSLARGIAPSAKIRG